MNPAIEFLLKGKGPLPLVPFFRMVKAAGELGYTVGTTLRASSEEQWSRGIAPALGGFGSPEIYKYEASALGSSRII